MGGTHWQTGARVREILGRGSLESDLQALPDRFHNLFSFVAIWIWLPVFGYPLFGA